MGEARRRKLFGEYPSQDAKRPRWKGFCFSMVDGEVVMADPVDITPVPIVAVDCIVPGYSLDGKLYLDISDIRLFPHIIYEYKEDLKIFSHIANALEDANRCGDDRDYCVCFIVSMDMKHPEIFGIAFTYSIGSASYDEFLSHVVFWRG
jgi:hypothetical protein